ncbi:rod shape-determining protein MreC [Candidatus Roizmanbacteria bacterium]|nr:rod shape-determining protein MreC [Candidatus Roizmanbacteria bacterium]
MQKKNNFFFPFLLVFLIAGLIFLLSSFGLLNGINSVLGKFLSPIETLTYTTFHKLPFISENREIKKLKDENLRLSKMLLDQNKLQSENSALNDQFAISNPRSKDLLRAKVVGAPGFIPGVSFPQVFIIDKGGKDGVMRNQAVVFGSNLVGRIEKATDNSSRITLVSNSSFSFTAKTDRGAIGIIKGEGSGKIILDNVLLSEDLKKDDFVYTRGDLDENNVGMPEDLIVGKIESVEKHPSALFQKAQVQSLIDFTGLFDVFVVL